MDHEYAFEMAASAVRFGAGVTREVGADLHALGVRRALVVTDPTVSRLAAMQTVLASLDAAGIDVEVFDRVRVEPTDESFLEAIAFARRGSADGFVAVGGGSAIDTAKAANLYSTYPPADFLDYVNPPVGKGMPVPGPLKPLIAVPTTAGTGSETTGVSIFDLTRLHAKTGIASRLLKPTLGLVDPENTRTLPPAVAASSGLDILSHAVESFTALPYTARPRPDRPSLRPAYQGSNPISDLWSLQAMRLVNQFLVRAVDDPEDDEARGNMLLAASYAGIGFGNAGVHLPHGMSYPVSGHVRDYRAPGYDVDHPLVPHGMSVILNAPAVFRFTAEANPARHLAAAEALGADDRQRSAADAGEVLADRITWFMQRLNVPNGLRALGYTTADIPALVEGTLPQHRVTKLSPRPAGPEDLARLFERAMVAW
jgi:hydroxyacid-oxoacid transhydrogenase